MKTIETERLILRGFREEDARELYEYLSRESVVRYEPYGVQSLDDAIREAARRSRDPSFIAVCLKDSGKLIGNLYFSDCGDGQFELGYVFNDHYWHNGYATESARALLDAAFEKMGAQKVTAMCNPENTSSWRLLERLGMKRTAHLKNHISFFTDEKGQPIWNDTYVYAITAEDRRAALSLL